MAQSTMWWLLAGGLVAAELLTGTFYLLMLAIGVGAAAAAAHLGASTAMQCIAAALVGGGAVVFWHLRQLQQRKEPPAQANANVSLDIGEIVHVTQWNADGTAQVQYRGAQWTAIRRTGVAAHIGTHKVAELVGNRLLVEKVET